MRQLIDSNFPVTSFGPLVPYPAIPPLCFSEPRASSLSIELCNSFGAPIRGVRSFGSQVTSD